MSLVIDAGSRRQKSVQNLDFLPLSQKVFSKIKFLQRFGIAQALSIKYFFLEATISPSYNFSILRVYKLLGAGAKMRKSLLILSIKI